MPQNKYLESFNRHPFNATDATIAKSVEKIINEKCDSNNNIEVYKKIYSCIDLTSLNSTDSKEDIWSFTQKVNDFEDKYPNLENVAAICVYPNFAKTVKDSLTVDTNIACVSGGFPSSQTFSEIKIAETALAIADGANEIDIVLNLGLFEDRSYQELSEEISEIKEACHDATLKVILETGALKTLEDIHKASILALYSGADFLKTSTGKGYPGASPEAAYVMSNAIKSYFKKTGTKVGIKLSGGISTVKDAIMYYTIVKEVLGEEWCNKSLFRIGASRLANSLLKEITENQTT